MNISLKSDKASSFSKNIFRGTFSSIHQSAATVEICYFMHLALKDRNFSRLSIALPWKLICVSCNKIIRANSWFKSRGLSFALDQFVITDAAELQPAAVLKNDFSQVFPKCSLKFAKRFISQKRL